MKTTPSLSWKLKRFDSQLLSIYTVKRKFILGISRCMYRYLLWVKIDFKFKLSVFLCVLFIIIIMNTRQIRLI